MVTKTSSSARTDGPAGDNWSRVQLCSGRTGEVLASYESEFNHTEFGIQLGRLGDIDGDGRAEFIAVATYYDYDPRGPLSAAGRAYVLSYVPETKPFIRADTDLDGDIDISDAMAILLHLYAGQPALCEEATDVNRIYGVDLTDAFHILIHLFFQGLAPDPPYPDCGRFETFRKRLPCEVSSCR